MAFPRQIMTGGLEAHDNSGFTFGGPFLATNGNFYYFGVNGTSLDASSPGSTADAVWSLQDTGGNPTIVADTGWCVVQDGNTFHVYYQSSSGTLSHNTFNAADDTWGTEEDIDTGAYIQDADNPLIADFCSAALRSDGDQIVIYADDTEKVMGVDRSRIALAREEGAGWTIGIDPTGGAQGGVENGFKDSSIAVAASSDRAHITYIDGNMRLTTYTSGNVFNGSEHLSINGSSHSNFGIVSYDDGGTKKLRQFHRRTSGTDIGFVNRWDDADTVSASGDIETDNEIYGAITAPTGPTAGCIAIDGTTKHYMYTRDTDRDLYHSKTGAGDDTWEADTVVQTGTFEAVNCNVLGTVLGYVYFDGTNSHYDEIDLNGAPPPRRIFII